MCMSCGCGQPNNNHGDNRNITEKDLNQAAQAAGITPEQAAKNISTCCQQMGSGTSAGQGSSGQSQSQQMRQ